MNRKLKIALALIAILLIGLIATRPSESDFIDYMSSYQIKGSADLTTSGIKEARLEKDYLICSVFAYDLFINGKQVDSKLNEFRYIGILGTFYSL